MELDIEQILIGGFAFVVFAAYGVFEALANAKSTILDGLLSITFEYDLGSSLGDTVAFVVLGVTVVIVFVVIPGRLGLFKMLLGKR